MTYPPLDVSVIGGQIKNATTGIFVGPNASSCCEPNGVLINGVEFGALGTAILIGSNIDDVTIGNNKLGGLWAWRGNGTGVQINAGATTAPIPDYIHIVNNHLDLAVAGIRDLEPSRVRTTSSIIQYDVPGANCGVGPRSTQFNVSGGLVIHC